MLVAPRWPARSVRIDAACLDALTRVQQVLPPHLILILTRAFEPRSARLHRARQLFRACGMGLFALLFPARRAEIGDIFGANGHDIDGTHVDLSICVDGKRLRFLPLGVLTPLAWQARRVARHRHALSSVCAALQAHGFALHRNSTESLQIHCDYISAVTPCIGNVSESMR